MSEPRNVIELDGVSKVFEVFKSPRARMMATLGLPARRGVREEFVAVDDISFSIRPGERVGLVGRNGAGKSTVLKMVAGLLRPTRGRVVVNGNVQALLELGTGFHPEFTGRQNVFASLAYQGISGKQAQRAFDDVLDFSELDDFIDRPVKTYSAGMYARLAFATATAVRPEVLIVDEILGAGDAYFSMKSSHRMQTLTSQGTTVLFVSHDIGAVQMMCDRAIWIDRGRMIGDDVPHVISKRYSTSIRKQSELRLKADNLKLLRAQVENLEADGDDVVVCRLVAPPEMKIAKPVRIHEITVSSEGLEIDRVPIGGARDNDSSEGVHLLTAPEYMNWGNSKKDNGRSYREVGEFGGIYGHAPFLVKTRSVDKLSSVTIEIEHGPIAEGSCLEIQQHGQNGYRTIGTLDPGPARVTIVSMVGDDQVTAEIEDEVIFDLDARYGTDIAAITSVWFADANGDHRFVYEVGEDMSVHIDWSLDDDTMVKEAVWVVCVYSMDGRCISQVLSPPNFFLPRSGHVAVEYTPSQLGRGEYLVSVGLFEGLSDDNPGASDPICVLDRSFKIKITAPSLWVERGLVLQQPTWRIGATR